MPIVTIQIARGGSSRDREAVTAEQKAALIQGVSELLLNVHNKPLSSAFVEIEEVALDNWGWGGLPIPKLGRQRRVGPT